MRWVREEVSNPNFMISERKTQQRFFTDCKTK